MRNDFWVLVEARADGGERIADPGPLARSLTEAVRPFHGGCSVTGDVWDARVSVDAADAVEAGAVAAALVQSLAGKAGLPAWPIVRVEAVRADVLRA